MPNVLAHPAAGEELDSDDLILARFEEAEDDEWESDRGEDGWDDDDDVDDDDDDEDWEDDDDEWSDDEEEEWSEDEGWEADK